MMNGTATDPQITRIKDTLTANSLYDGDYDRLWKQLEVHEIDVRTPGDGTRMGKQQASGIIDWLAGRGYYPNRTPNPANGGQATRSDTPAEPGVYRRDDRLYVVREFTPRGESRKVRYARQIVPLSPGQGDRLNGHDERVRIEERKAPGMQYQLTPAEALPMEDVRSLSLQWQHCLICGKGIRVAESIERGIGPVCYGRQTALLARREVAPA